MKILTCVRWSQLHVIIYRHKELKMRNTKSKLETIFLPFDKWSQNSCHLQLGCVLLQNCLLFVSLYFAWGTWFFLYKQIVIKSNSCSQILQPASISTNKDNLKQNSMFHLKPASLRQRNQEKILFRLLFGRLNAHSCRRCVK